MVSTRLKITGPLETAEDYHRLIEDNRSLLGSDEKTVALYSGREVVNPEFQIHNGHLAQELGTNDSSVTEPEARRIWAHASQVLCEQAKGNVLAFVVGADPTKTFRQVELPALLRNELVSSINYAPIGMYREAYQSDLSAGKAVSLDRIFEDIKARLDFTSLTRTFNSFDRLSRLPAETSEVRVERYSVNAAEYAHQIETRLIPQLEYLQKKIDVERVKSNFDPYTHKYRPTMSPVEAIDRARAAVLGPEWEQARRRMKEQEKHVDQLRDRAERFNEEHGSPNISAANYRKSQALSKELKLAYNDYNKTLAVFNTHSVRMSTPEIKEQIKVAVNDLMNSSKATQGLQRKLDLQHSHVRTSLQEAYQLNRTLNDIGDRSVTLEQRINQVVPKLLGSTDHTTSLNKLTKQRFLER